MMTLFLSPIHLSTKIVSFVLRDEEKKHGYQQLTSLELCSVRTTKCEKNVLVIPVPSDSCDVKDDDCWGSFVSNVCKCFPSTSKLPPPTDCSDEDSDDSASESPQKKIKEEDDTITHLQCKVAHSLADLKDMLLNFGISSNIDKFFQECASFYVAGFSFLLTSFELNVGCNRLCVAYSHSLIKNDINGEQILSLFLPTRQYNAIYGDSDAILGETEEENYVRWNTKIFTLGSSREDGGKSSSEMLKNMKMRHASGSMSLIVEPSSTLTDVINSIPDALMTQVDASMELRYRSIVGNHPNRDTLMKADV